jgi:excisionase family DNA binding protein
MRAEPGRGYTPNEVARLLRVSPDKVRTLIRTGRLGAVDVSSGGKVRFVIMPAHLDAFVKAHAACPPHKPRRRPKRSTFVDFFPDL